MAGHTKARCFLQTSIMPRLNATLTCIRWQWWKKKEGHSFQGPYTNSKSGLPGVCCETEDEHVLVEEATAPIAH